MTDEDEEGCSVIYVEPKARKLAFVSFVVIFFDFIRAGFECWRALFEDISGAFVMHRAYKEQRAEFHESVTRDLESIQTTSETP